MLGPGTSETVRDTGDLGAARSLALELDPELFLPGFVRLVDPEGGVTEIRFGAIRINGEIPADRFDLPD